MTALALLGSNKTDSLTKVAVLGGDGSETQFQQAFSNLAHAFIQDRAPSLLDYEQGFQLLDRDQDGKKAAGVMAFKVGSSELFVPCFFLKGQLKGHEMLYMKNQDLFVPMKENWLNYVINRKPSVMGESVTRQTGQLGALPPDFTRMRASPYKFAAHIPERFHGYLPVYAALTDPQSLLRQMNDLDRHCEERLNLGDFLKQANLPMLESLVDYCQRYPEVAESIVEYHGIDVLESAIKSASARCYQSVLTNRILEKSAADPDHRGIDMVAKNKVEVIRFDANQVTVPLVHYPEKDYQKLLEEGLLINDERGDDEVSIPYNVQVEQSLFNPQNSGLYMVLTKSGDYEKCLVLLNPHGAKGRSSGCTLVRIEGGEKDWINTWASDVWVSSRIEGEEFDKWFKDLPDVKSLSPSFDKYIFIGPRCESTLPFCVIRDLGKSDIGDSYDVDFSNSRAGRSNSPMSRYNKQQHDPYDGYSGGYGERIQISNRLGTKIRASQGDVIVPDYYKQLRVEKSDYQREPYDSDSQSKTPPLRPGNLADAELALKSKTAALRIIHDGHRMSLNGDSKLGFADALATLVLQHGLREKAARELITEAARKRAVTFRVKYAGPYLTEGGGPNAPVMPEQQVMGSSPMGGYAPATAEERQHLPVGDLSASMTDRSVYDPRPEATQSPFDTNAVANANDSGQKGNLDTAMIGQMLRTNRDESMIDRYLPDLIKGMDKKARVLFGLFAHGDKFAERYGKGTLPELEDALRDAFERDGDIILMLKQKTVDPYPELNLPKMELDN